MSPQKHESPSSTMLHSSRGRGDGKDERLPKIQQGRGGRGSFEANRAMLASLYQSPHQTAAAAMTAAAAARLAQSWDVGMHEILRGIESPPLARSTKQQQQQAAKEAAAAHAAYYASANGSNTGGGGGGGGGGQHEAFSLHVGVDVPAAGGMQLSGSLHRPNANLMMMAYAPVQSPYMAQVGMGGQPRAKQPTKGQAAQSQQRGAAAGQKGGNKEATAIRMAQDIGSSVPLSAAHQPQHGASQFSTAGGGTHRKYASHQVGRISPHFGNASRGGDAGGGQRAYPPFASIYLPTSKPIATWYHPVLRTESMATAAAPPATAGGTAAGGTEADAPSAHSTTSLFMSAPFPNGMGGGTLGGHSPSRRHGAAGGAGAPPAPSLNNFMRSSTMSLGLSPRAHAPPRTRSCCWPPSSKAAPRC